MADEVTRLLADVAAGLPGGGEARPGQQQMASAVAHALDEHRHLIVQAGTGTGKSLGYLVPVALSGTKVVVATATKALQDQLADSDLPQVAAAARGDLTFAVLKGRSNYLCRQRVAEIGERGEQLSMADEPSDPAAGPKEAGTTEAGPGDGDPGDSDPGDSGPGDSGPGDSGPGDGRLGDQVRRLVAWADETTSGDRAELDFEPRPQAWAAVSMTARDCPGAFRCPSGDTCLAEAARARAAAADVVVVNMHLYGAHVASGGAVLPEHEVVVFDEAHELESIMTDCLGIELGPGRFRNLVNSSRSVVGDGSAAAGVVEDVGALSELLVRALTPLAGTRLDPASLQAAPPGAGSAPPPGDGDGAANDATAPSDRTAQSGDRAEPEPEGLNLGLPPLPAPPRRRSRAAPAEVGPTARTEGRGPPLAEVLALASSRVARLVDRLRQAQREADGVEPQTTRSRRDRALLAAGHLAADLERLAAPTEDDVPWVEDGPRSPSLRLSPIDVGPILAERVWTTTTGILTSATVPVGLGARLGLPEDGWDELDAGSPFDYREHALLYVARSLPDRRRPASEPAVHDELVALITAAGGRTLALFTSWRAMRAAVAAVRDQIDLPLLTQADLPKPLLVQQFRDREEACLFATLGFWQGVDVPGRTLSLVTIDRIPFPRPDEPILEARRERAGADAFRVVDLPRAGTLLAQGAGRLIRSSEDRGVVAVLDSRLATASYRRALLARVPPMRRTVDRPEVEAFLREVTADPVASVPPPPG